MHIPAHRHSIGNNETPLAMNKNFEYFASTASGANAQQSSQRIAMNTMHKPSNSQVVPNVGGSDHTSLLNPGTSKQKISTLKNKAAFEKFHPSQHAA